MHRNSTLLVALIGVSCTNAFAQILEPSKYHKPSDLPFGTLTRDGFLRIWDLIPESKKQISEFTALMNSGRANFARSNAANLRDPGVRAYCLASIDFQRDTIKSHLRTALDLATAGETDSRMYCLSVVAVLLDHGKNKHIADLVPRDKLDQMISASQGNVIESLFATRIQIEYEGIGLTRGRVMVRHLVNHFPQHAMLKSYLAALMFSSEVDTRPGFPHSTPQNKVEGTKLREEIFKEVPDNEHNLSCLANDYLEIGQKGKARKAIDVYFQKYKVGSEEYRFMQDLKRRVNGL